MAETQSAIDQYMALALQPVMVGAHKRADIGRNLERIAELAFAAKNVTEIEMPVRLCAQRLIQFQWFVPATIMRLE